MRISLPRIDDDLSGETRSHDNLNGPGEDSDNDKKSSHAVADFSNAEEGRSTALNKRSDKSRFPTAPRRSLEESRQWSVIKDADFTVLPSAKSGRKGPVILFFFVVLAPLAALLCYYIWFASPQYTAEFRFSVNQVQASGSSSSSSSASNALATLGSLAGGGASPFSSASPQNFIVVDYLTSRQAVDDLNAKVDLRKVYGAPSIDWWSRLKTNASPEQLVTYWNSMISTYYDPLTGIASAQVTAYSARDAFVIAQTLETLSEKLVNDITERAQKDAVRFAQDEVTRAQARLDHVREQLANFREREGVIDPNPTIIAANDQLAAGLRANLAQLQASLDGLRRQNLDASAPQAVALRAQIAATNGQINAIENEVGAKHGGQPLLANVEAQFEAITLDLQYAQTLLLTDLQNLDVARANAAAQHMYLMAHVRPSLPGSAIGPHIVKNTSIAALLLMCVWFALLLCLRSIKYNAA